MQLGGSGIGIDEMELTPCVGTTIYMPPGLFFDGPH